MVFRYFDAEGRQLTPEQLHSMGVQTPAMDHVFATVAERVEKTVNSAEPVESGRPG